MQVQPGYHNGFAPRDFAPAHPWAWDGCVGAWCPSLGPTGATLYDWSGRQNAGTLTNFTLADAWAINDSQYALLHDASNDYIALPSAPTYFLTAAQPFSLCWWERITSTSTTFPSRFRLAISGGSSALGLIRTSISSFANLATFSMSGGNFRATDAPTLTAGVGVWIHYVVASAGGPNSTTIGDWSMYANGSALTVATSTTAHYGDNTLNRIGYDGADEGANAMLDDVRIYQRKLSPAEVSQLYRLGRGGAYIPAQQRRRYAAGASFNAAWARGSNVYLSGVV